MIKQKQQCGIIMPISGIDSCHESHWLEVLAFLKELIEEAVLKGDIVSYADEVGIIQNASLIIYIIISFSFVV